MSAQFGLLKDHRQGWVSFASLLALLREWGEWIDWARKKSSSVHFVGVFFSFRVGEIPFKLVVGGCNIRKILLLGREGDLRGVAVFGEWVSHWQPRRWCSKLAAGPASAAGTQAGGCSGGVW